MHHNFQTRLSNSNALGNDVWINIFTFFYDKAWCSHENMISYQRLILQIRVKRDSISKHDSDNDKVRVNDI